MTKLWSKLTDRLWRTRMAARAVLIVGRLWPLVVLPLCIVGLYLAASWFGLFRWLPDTIRLALLATFLLVLLASLVPLLRFRRPGAAEIDRHIERVNRLAHTPIRAQTDSLAGDPDEFARTLWRVHQQRLAQGLGNLSGGMPRTGLPDRDPWGLRAAVALLAVIALAWSYGPLGGSIADAWRPPAGSIALAARIDAWVTPPAYTGKAPLFLTAAANSAQTAFSAPAGSVLTVRASGGSGDFSLERKEGAPIDADSMAEAGARQYSVTLDADAELLLRGDGGILRSWSFSIIPDLPPTISFAGEPQRAVSGALELAYEIEDDYGIASAAAEFALAEPQAAGARPLYDAPDFPLATPRRGKTAARSSRDLTAHPWAGALVDLRLKAMDDAGQAGESETRRLVLPQRTFFNPLAEAIVEQRRLLALDANSRPRVLEMLEAILLWPEETIANAAHFLALSVAQRRLEQARSDERLRNVVDYMWEVARGIEDGALSAAERRLLQAQEDLRQALEEGATDEQIEQLMAELREALDEFLRQFAERAMQDPNRMMQMPPDGMEMSQSDLDRLLDQIEELAKSGAREQAQDLLSQLEQMMNNLQAMQQQEGQQGGGRQDAMREQMDQLGDIMRQQQELMNETFRMDQQRRNSRPGDRRGGIDPKEFADAMRRLQQGQRALQEQLGELMEGMSDLGMEPGEGLGEAGEHMGNAGRALGQGDGRQATGEQGEALQSLRRGAQEMMNQMQQAGNEGPGARSGRQGSGGDRDPLGRPRANTGPDFGDSVDVPDEIDVQRARRILESIRRRLGDALSPAMEREYLERLLELR